ncbi:MAG TPA: MmcQ/YjbR family DNA-binding protein [Caulobacteraceae bacterium]|nr:MmcQ/YjbR family DNA-binding protein [Caulobacteraceae bacterium]
MTEAEVRALALSLPQVEEATAYGHPAFKAFGKFLARVRHEDNSIVFVGIDFDERDMLMEAEPEVFHITAHYKNYPSVLARLDTVDSGTVKSFLERRWRECAPKKFLKQWDASQAP